MRSTTTIQLLVLASTLATLWECSVAFTLPQLQSRAATTSTIAFDRNYGNGHTVLRLTPEEEGRVDVKFSREIAESTTNLDATASPISTAMETSAVDESDEGAAATNTVNERLMAELQAAENKERFGARSSAGRKMGLVDGFGRPRKTPEEIEAAIAEARDLNGVNPVVALAGSFFALAVAAALWYGTNQLGVFFALHPVESEVYFVTRFSIVVRNVAIGLVSLASGFFGVTGLGIFLLGVRVAVGVASGELDPTPIKRKTQKEKVEMPNVWDLMMNKKPNRRGARGSNDNNPFGI